MVVAGACAGGGLSTDMLPSPLPVFEVKTGSSSPLSTDIWERMEGLFESAFDKVKGELRRLHRDSMCGVEYPLPPS